MTARLLIGDVFDRMAELPDDSVDCLITSPPFLALRSYLPADHPLKGKEIGSEATPAQFLDTMLALTAEWRRLLAPHGSLCVELGDTYSGSGGAGGDYGDGGLRAGQPKFRQVGSREHRPERDGTGADGGDRIVPSNGGPGWPLAKSLTGIPTLYTWSLAYGRNLLTGQPSPAGQWRIRNLLVWARPNPPVGALGDKFRPATSYITVACTGAKRWFDLDAVREPAQDTNPRSTNGSKPRDRSESFAGTTYDERIGSNPAGAPPLDWHTDIDDGPNGDRLWWMTTAPYKGAHYATFPVELPQRLIKAMCPVRVCRECGKASERITETTYNGLRPNGRTANDSPYQTMRADSVSVSTLGWTDCGHDNWRPGHVLDPFAGSGTTLAAAVGLGRDAIGIDLDETNADLVRERCGMFLEVGGAA